MEFLKNDKTEPKEFKKYPLYLEISGKRALWKDPGSGSSNVSYPIPPRSAIRGIFESILWWKNIKIIPYKIHICSNPKYEVYKFNTRGYKIKDVNLRKGNAEQVTNRILVNPKFQIFAYPKEIYKEDIRVNSTHGYQEVFNRRMKRGQCFRVPSFGQSEFIVDYWGEFRKDTTIYPHNENIPSFLYEVFDGSKFNPTFIQNVQIVDGVYYYD